MVCLLLHIFFRSLLSSRRLCCIALLNIPLVFFSWGDFVYFVCCLVAVAVVVAAAAVAAAARVFRFHRHLCCLLVLHLYYNVTSIKLFSFCIFRHARNYVRVRITLDHLPFRFDLKSSRCGQAKVRAATLFIIMLKTHTHTHMAKSVVRAFLDRERDCAPHTEQQNEHFAATLDQKMIPFMRRFRVCERRSTSQNKADTKCFVRWSAQTIDFLARTEQQSPIGLWAHLFSAYTSSSGTGLLSKSPQPIRTIHLVNAVNAHFSSSIIGHASWFEISKMKHIFHFARRSQWNDFGFANQATGQQQQQPKKESNNDCNYI